MLQEYSAFHRWLGNMVVVELDKIRSETSNW